MLILEREYRVNCPAGAEEKLRAAARMLDEKMTEIKQASSASGTLPGLDRIAVIAALNIANQLQEAKNSVIEDAKDRKSTRLNSSHVRISYAVFCLKKKKIEITDQR